VSESASAQASMDIPVLTERMRARGVFPVLRYEGSVRVHVGDLVCRHGVEQSVPLYKDITRDESKTGHTMNQRLYTQISTQTSYLPKCFLGTFL
jgi:hypothetical protein